MLIFPYEVVTNLFYYTFRGTLSEHAQSSILVSYQFFNACRASWDMYLTIPRFGKWIQIEAILLVVQRYKSKKKVLEGRISKFIADFGFEIFYRGASITSSG